MSEKIILKMKKGHCMSVFMCKNQLHYYKLLLRYTLKGYKKIIHTEELEIETYPF